MRALKLKSILIAAIAATGLVAGNAIAGPTVDTFIKAYESANSGERSELGYLEDATRLDFTDGSLVKPNGKPGASFDVDSGLWVIDVAPTTPGYFLLKFGVGGTNTKLDTYVFQNTGDLTQLVWSNEQVKFLTGGACSSSEGSESSNSGKEKDKEKDKGKGKDQEKNKGKTGSSDNNNGSDADQDNCNIGRLSHISYVPGQGGGNSGGEVPEPASLALLGAGLAGLALRRRRA